MFTRYCCRSSGLGTVCWYDFRGTSHSQTTCLPQGGEGPGTKLKCIRRGSQASPRAHGKFLAEPDWDPELDPHSTEGGGGARIFKGAPANSSAQPGLRTSVPGTGDLGSHFFMPGSSKVLGTCGLPGHPAPEGLRVPFSAQSTHPIAGFAIFRITVQPVLLSPSTASFCGRSPLRALHYSAYSWAPFSPSRSKQSAF